MSTPPILLGSDRVGPQRSLDPWAGWGPLVTMAVALLLVGVTDVGLAMYPARFGNVEWRFSVLASVANGLPMVGVGALVLLVASLNSSASWGLVVAAALNILVLVGIVAATIGFLTASGPAFASAPAEVHLGLQKAVAKSLIIFVAFAVAHLAGVVDAARRLRGRPSL